MIELNVVSEGRLLVRHSTFNVFILEDGRKAVSVSSVYQFLRDRKVNRGARNALSSVKFKRYLPSEMLDSPEIVSVWHGELICLFYAEEWVALCCAIVRAAMNEELSKSWFSALVPAQILLMEFALEGANVLIDKAIKKNPVITVEKFDTLVKGLLARHYESGSLKRQ